MRIRWLMIRWLSISVVIAPVGITGNDAPLAAAQSAEERELVTLEERIASSPIVGLSAPARLSTIERQALLRKHLERRERIADRAKNDQPYSPPGRAVAEVSGQEAQIVETEVEVDGPPYAGANVGGGSPSSFHIGRNYLNTRAGTVGETLAEPTATNEGVHVFYTGNTHAEFSTNGGNTWTDVPIPDGPGDAPFACCDITVVYDQARAVTFWSVLYFDGGINGVVRIFVRREISHADNCSYIIDPAGASNDILPDRPYLGLSNDFLYLSTNNLHPGGWVGAQVRRFNIDEMAACASPVSVRVFTYDGPTDQRVFTPVEGARETMYWGVLQTTRVFQVFKWPETSAGPTSMQRPVPASTFKNPDCRGGLGNFDFIESPTAWSITGHRLRGAVGGGRVSFFWNVGPDAQHSQGHVHGAVFRESDLQEVMYPPIFSSARCFGYPVVSANDRGDLGLSIAAGGRSGGGGTAAQGYVGIDDDFTPGIGNFKLVLAAAGTHNREDERYGDYMSIHPHRPCGLFFAATAYALTDRASPESINARYLEFGRFRDRRCYYGWRDETRLP
jgi:hypothetical protein